jgi:purine nucleosidase
VKILLDTDIGTDVDDAIALLLAVRSPEIELASVTTVSARTEVRAALARRLLALAGRPSVPVAAGISRSLPSDRFGEFLPGGLWFGHEGRGVLSDAEISRAPDADGEAAIAQIVRILSAADEPHTVVTIGPVGNVALALDREPSIAENIARIVIMGGCVMGMPKLGDVEMPPIAEFNLNADREAAYRVLHTAIPITLVPVEVTLRTYFEEQDVAALRATNEPASKALANLIDHWVPIYREMTAGVTEGTSPTRKWVCHLHDPLALLAVVNPALLEFSDVCINVEEEDGVLRTRSAPDGSVTVRVAVDTDPEAVRRFVMERVSGQTGGVSNV